MNEFAIKFTSQINNFWDISENEKKKVLIDILNYANSNQQKFKYEINLVKFDKDLSVLPVVLEALSVDTENWGQFYVDLLDDILETAKQSNNSFDILKNLSDFCYIENNSKPFVEKIVERLLKSSNLKT